MTTEQKTVDSENAHCALTVRLTFVDRIDVDDAVDTMEVCITDALSFEPSIEEVPSIDAGNSSQAMAGKDNPDSENARYALTVRLMFADRVDADDVVDRIEHCILKALSFESSIDEV